MFELMNENEPLYQWDLNRKLYVADSSIKEVHFDTFDTSEALVVEVKEDGTAEIPNILLQ